MATQAPVAFPLGAPTISQNKLTVDMALEQPNRITKRLSDITLQKFIVDRIFSTSGVAIAGGAIIHDVLAKNELYLTRDVEQRGPGDEYPKVSGERLEPQVAKVEDWGGKFDVTDQAKKRNRITDFDNQVTQLGNTLVRKVNGQAIKVLDAAITSLGGAGLVTGHDWSNITLSGNSPTPNNARPGADFRAVQLAADKEELGIVYDLWLMNPEEESALMVAYGEDYAAWLQSMKVEIFSSNRVTAGEAFAVAKGQVGFLDYEEGLTTETWREEKTRKTWVQSYVMPIMGITNPYAIKKIVGLGG